MIPEHQKRPKPLLVDNTKEREKYIEACLGIGEEWKELLDLHVDHNFYARRLVNNHPIFVSKVDLDFVIDKVKKHVMA